MVSMTPHFTSPLRKPQLIPILGLLMCSGTVASVSEPGECTHLLERVTSQYGAYARAGNENWEDLLPLFDEAKACYGATHSAETARMTDYESSVLYKLGRYEEAEAALSRFIDHEAEFAEPNIRAGVYQRRAVLYAHTDRPLDALQDYMASAQFVDELSPANGAKLLNRIGNWFRSIGDYDAALPYYVRADSLVVAHLGEDPDLEAIHGQVLSSKAALYIEAANRGVLGSEVAAAEAATLLEAALNKIPSDDPEFLYERINVLLWLAYAYRERGDPDLAFPLIREARELGTPIIRRYPELVSWTYTEDGRAQLELGNLAEAREALQTALSMDREVGKPVHEMESLVDLGLLAEAIADTSSTPVYDIAEAYYERAITIAEVERRTFGNLEWSASMFAGSMRPYRYLIRLLLREGRYEEAFLRLDETRARYLQDLRLTNRMRPRLNADLRKRIDSLETVQDDARYASLNPDISDADRATFFSEALDARMEANRLMGFTPTAPPALTLATVQRVLEERDQTLVTYFLDEDASYVLVVRPDTIVGVELPVVVDSLSQLITAVGEAWLGSDQPEPFLDPAILSELHASLIEPVAHLLLPNGALVIIPEGLLTALPFAALGVGEETDFAERDYLGQNHPISMELSAALLTEPPEQRESSANTDLMAFGRSIFEGESNALQIRFGQPLADLPDVPNELNNLRNLFPSGHFALNQEATEGALYSQIQDSRVVHLASHAIMNPTFPLFSYISLWGSEGAQDTEDGTLFLYELQNRTLQSDLVVLSGCSTARGENHLGEGMIGLQHAFRAAGAASTLATMWQVEDGAMTELMTSFYEHLRAGQRKDRALQLAQRDYLEANSGTRASPFFWASATFYGNPSSVDWKHTYVAQRTWFVLGALLLLSSLVIPYLIRRRTAQLLTV